MKNIVGAGTKSHFLPMTGLPVWESFAAKVIDVQAPDQIVTVSANVSVAELQSALAHHGLCLPLPDPQEYGLLLSGIPGTVGGLIAANLPHGLSAQCGGPRQWVLQLEVLFKGEPAQSGAKVVKSVAGYDVHKAYVGSWGGLGPILSATLRARSQGSLPTVQSRAHGTWDGQDVWIGRTLPSYFDDWRERAQNVLAEDRPSCTLWAGSELEPPTEGWLMGPRGFRWSSHDSGDLPRRMKSVFDPQDDWYAPFARPSV